MPRRSSSSSAPPAGCTLSGSCRTTRSTSARSWLLWVGRKRGSASTWPSCIWPAGSTGAETDDESSTAWSTPTSSPWSTKGSNTCWTKEPHGHPYRANLRLHRGQEDGELRDRPAERLRWGRKETAASAGARRLMPCISRPLTRRFTHRTPWCAGGAAWLTRSTSRFNRGAVRRERADDPKPPARHADVPIPGWALVRVATAITRPHPRRRRREGQSGSATWLHRRPEPPPARRA